MGKPKVTVTFSKREVLARLNAANQEGITEISNELLKDANYYARKDTGELIGSSQRASIPEKGLLVWDTPYAKKMYYVGNPALDENPNASLMWAHKAKEKNNKKYLKILRNILKRRV